MDVDLKEIRRQTETAVRELVERGNVRQGGLIVFGTSTSEVAGLRIGSAPGSERAVAAQAEAAAKAIFEAIEAVRKQYGFDCAFQCCEHLNRALVVERAVLERLRLEEVSAVPVPGAGGSMAAHAYRRMNNPCLVEEILADAGLDIGDTLIGMHLRRVAVPVRLSVNTIGKAHVTAAVTRPKLIGGRRAVYSVEESLSRFSEPDECP